MPANEFPRALAAVLAHEGGWANHPQDPGGATMRGVTQRVYDPFREAKGLPHQSVRMISDGELQAIYKRQYWDVVRGDDLPAGVAYCVFDFAVNSGPARAAKALQRALGVAADGQIGLATVAAARDHQNHDALIGAICDERLRFVRALGTYKTFGKGWESRIAGVRKRAQAWASGLLGPSITAEAPQVPKALPKDAAPRPGTGPADAAVAAGTGAGGIAGTLQQTKDQLEPLAGASPWIGTAVAVLAIASAVLVIGGLAWRWYQSRRAAEHDEALQ